MVSLKMVGSSIIRDTYEVYIKLKLCSRNLYNLITLANNIYASNLELYVLCSQYALTCGCKIW